MGDISILLSLSLAIASAKAVTSVDSIDSSGRRIMFTCTIIQIGSVFPVVARGAAAQNTPKESNWDWQHGMGRLQAKSGQAVGHYILQDRIWESIILHLIVLEIQMGAACNIQHSPAGLDLGSGWDSMGVVVKNGSVPSPEYLWSLKWCFGPQA